MSSEQADKLPIGVMVRKKDDIAQRLSWAADSGAACVQIWCERGHFNVDSATPQWLGDIRKQAGDLGLTISALCGDTGKGFTSPETVREVVDRTKRMLDLCAGLETPVLTSHVGHLDPDDTDRWNTALDALAGVAEAARERNLVFASETGAEPGPVLAQFIKQLNQPAIKVNFDPANYVRRNFDITQAIESLAGCIGHVHAKDGKYPAGDEKVGTEEPIGSGDVDFPWFLGALLEAGYDGPVVIEREGHDEDNYNADVEQGVRRLWQWRQEVLSSAAGQA